MGHRKNQAFLKRIAVRIKIVREKAGITQEQFYNDTDIHIGRIERAQINITVVTLKEICQYFGISLRDFFREIE
jgi:transcriptional regulator with XRE-family HTH domain